ncbi:MAG: hypothetical protein Q9222_003258 [Ikaeria aurantiellina]
MVDPPTDGHNAGNSSIPPVHKVSVMRKFLESGVEFEWPPGVGEHNGSHCKMHSGPIPLIWRSKISDKKASIDIYVGGPQYAFKEPFAVKTVRERTNAKSKTRARTEIENMKDLRYPHVAALLGTFTWRDSLHILIFPAAPCDLQVFMRMLSKETKDLHRGRSAMQELLFHHTRTDTPESRSSTSSIREGSGSPRFSNRSLSSPSNSTDPTHGWPLRLPMPAKVDCLRGYFVCLSQALRYIHESDVRHKDIKPENILIDASGAVVLTDFGISRRFPKKAPHVTNDKWEMTQKYASPEIMRGKKQPRDDPSDVFSLGCVFLEMASLILGRDLDRMIEYYATRFTDSSVLNDDYYRNLDRVYSWIEALEKQKDVDPRSVPDLTDERVDGQDFIPDPNSKMMEALGAVRRMLDIEPWERPLSRDLWQHFQHVSSQKCQDCDPRLPKEVVWTPNKIQKKASESGTSRRRSMQQIPEELSDNPSMETKDGQSEDGKLLSANYRSDPRGLRRASSPNTSRRQSPSGMFLKPTSLPASLQPPVDIPESFSTVVLPPPPDENSQIRRTTSATDNPRNSRHGDSKVSRSTSPTKRMPLPDGRAPSRVRQDPSVSATNMTNQQEKASHPPPGLDANQVINSQPVQSTAPVSTIKKTNSHSENMEDREKSGTNGQNSHHKQEQLSPTTHVIIYDLVDKLAYVGAWQQLKGMTEGKDYISKPLPKSGQHIEIGEKGSPIATVDLGPLGWWVRARRWMGEFPMLYVLHYSVRPLG